MTRVRHAGYVVPPPVPELPELLELPELPALAVAALLSVELAGAPALSPPDSFFSPLAPLLLGVLAELALRLSVM